ncbi:porin family protein [Paraflavitalea speifideaquila]|uniref:porin family protein n=1 Tax=Paraflavitalea speifideaquila TaxID=3076558 RepID=UPI00331302D4
MIAKNSALWVADYKTTSETSLQPKIGIKGGINLSNLYVDDVEDENMKVGVNVGVFAKFPLTRGFSIQPELLYSSKGAKLTYNNILGQGEYRFNLNYVELPILAVFNLGKNFNIHAGPYAALLTSANIKRKTSQAGM